ncbi:MAG: hypothetical protein KBONHNOK_00962 [Candidatus Methanoperedenaceae archaeon GB50]|nr:MAG: hypothetical protein KBONHNOK_00962 [Candidatus Methanoperedenaceae archaeon GB50]
MMIELLSVMVALIVRFPATGSERFVMVVTGGSVSDTLTEKFTSPCPMLLDTSSAYTVIVWLPFGTVRRKLLFPLSVAVSPIRVIFSILFKL